ncbi:MAG TPA: ABC transporter permease [Clostridia bacterium]|jgi:osmoprotectant transport system permease protein|nr:ABC transporter permease [Clostridia bacterium]
MKLIQFFLDNSSYILEKVGEHLYLAGFAVLLACAVGIPVGFLITNNKRVASIVVGIANTIQTIPSLALFAFAISVFGIGADNAIFALFLYALLPIIKNTLIGIRNVSPTMIEAARGMGMSRAQIMFQVEVPLAISVIMGGVRIATVTAIGIATIATLIGAGGLGQLIYQGIGMMNYEMIFAGAICSAALALLADFLLGLVEKKLTSKGLSRHIQRAKPL